MRKGRRNAGGSHEIDLRRRRRLRCEISFRGGGAGPRRGPPQNYPIGRDGCAQCSHRDSSATALFSPYHQRSQICRTFLPRLAMSAWPRSQARAANLEEVPSQRRAPMRRISREGGSAYRAPQGTKQRSVARGGPVPIVRPDGALRNTLVGNRLRNTEGKTRERGGVRGPGITVRKEDSPLDWSQAVRGVRDRSGWPCLSKATQSILIVP